MNENINNKRRRAMEILRLYSLSGLPDKLERRVKRWIACGTSEEKENALKDIWDHPFYVVSKRERRAAWRRVEQEIGVASRFRIGKWMWVIAVTILVGILVGLIYFTGDFTGKELPEEGIAMLMESGHYG